MNNINTNKTTLIAYDKYIVWSYFIWAIITGLLPIAYLSASSEKMFSLIGVAEAILSLGLFVTWINCIFKDTKQIAAMNILAPSRWWVLIMPVYLWKRANKLKTSKSSFWLLICFWIIASVLQAFVEVCLEDNALLDSEVQEQRTVVNPASSVVEEASVDICTDVNPPVKEGNLDLSRMLKVSLAQLGSDYENNALKSKNKYNKKWVITSGYVEDISVIGSTVILSLETGGLDICLNTFEFKDKKQLDQLANLEAGDYVYLCGRMDNSIDASVNLVSCYLLKIGK